VFLSPEQGTAQVEELIVLDEVSQGPFNFYTGDWPTVADYWQHEDTLIAMFSELRSALLPPGTPVQQKRRIFIVRPETRRNYNQAALLEIAREYGFEPVAPESMSLATQAKIYAEASHIIGASGAAWTNMIFAPKPFKALTWLPVQYSEFCSYAMLANLLGHDLRYLISQPKWEIKSTSDAYVAPYEVSLPEFEAAVANMCRET
jgi:capsular polysaccharide biosynthesis protein